MLFLMIGCVFLGAGPVGWMGRHIRMDVVVSLLPPRARWRVRAFLRPGHDRDLRRARDLRLAGHDHACRARPAQRYRQYPAGHSAGGGAGRPPADGAPDRGAALRAWRAPRRRDFERGKSSTEMSAGFVYFILPAILLILGLPIFVVLILTSMAAIAVRRACADAGDPDLHVRQPRQFSAAGGAVLRAGRRDHGPRRHRQPRRRLGGVDHRRRARLARGNDRRLVGTVRRHGAHLGRHRGRHRQAVVSVADQARLRRALRGEPHHLFGRGRRDHPAVDLDDPLRHDGAGLGDQAVHRRHPAEPADRRCRRGLCADLRASKNGAAVVAGALEEYLGLDQGSELGDRHASS